jgi:thiamine biosynthesis lipoprotein
MTTAVSRRRFLSISAAFAGLALVPGRGGTAAAAATRTTWRGVALGAPAEIILHHPDREAAEALLARISVEVARLERVFSLYQSDSALARLNQHGVLATPPPELVDLLEISRFFWALSGGAFDPTIQPLWRLHARHFSGSAADVSGPPRAEVAEALALVGFDRVVFNRDRIVLPRPGMALTLNGIAQGFITDRIVQHLRDAGVTSTMVDLGEPRAIGARDDGTAWRVGIAVEPRPEVFELTVVDRAVATSSAGGFRFAGPGSPCHLLDPGNGRAADRYQAVSVVAPDAATADALSTAFNFMDADRITRLVATQANVEAHLFLQDGEHVRLA